MDLNFEQLLASHNQDFKEAEVFNDWMPDDGEYIVSLIKLTSGTSNKDGVDTIWWNLKGRIEDVQDEKINGREFTVGYYTSKAFGILKGAVNILSGGEINDLAQANAILEAALGLVIRVRVRTSISKKNGKEYTNCFILEVINTTPETSAESVDVAPEPCVDPAPVEVPTNVPEPVTEMPGVTAEATPVA